MNSQADQAHSDSLQVSLTRPRLLTDIMMSGCTLGASVQVLEEPGSTPRGVSVQCMSQHACVQCYLCIFWTVRPSVHALPIQSGFFKKRQCDPDILPTVGLVWHVVMATDCMLLKIPVLCAFSLFGKIKINILIILLRKMRILRLKCPFQCLSALKKKNNKKKNC